MAAALGSACAAVILAAALLKAADVRTAATALVTYGVRGRVARPAVVVLVAVEAGLAAGLLAGDRGAGLAAATLMAGFAVVQAGLLAAGRAGAPCGCLGGAGRLSGLSVARAAALAAGCAVAAGAAPPPPLVALSPLCALGLALALRPRAPAGALEIADEGPAVGAATALTEWLPGADGRIRIAVFTAASCRVCRSLGPAFAALAGRSDVRLRTYEQERDREVWAAVDVPGAPFAVAVGTDGLVLAKGTVNTADQLMSVLHTALGRTRREVIGRAALAAGAAATAGLVKPGEADAFHFCGHIYTTDSCPHPTGLPRIDSRGRPLRASDGARVDNLGRMIDPGGSAVDDGGRPLLDPDGRRLPPAPRTTVCGQVARRYGVRMRVDGAWYRCCDGQVRKLVDCCTTGRRRVNGDRALTGYCYAGRKVFCVMYYDTRVPC